MDLPGSDKPRSVVLAAWVIPRTGPRCASVRLCMTEAEEDQAMERAVDHVENKCGFESLVLDVIAYDQFIQDPQKYLKMIWQQAKDSFGFKYREEGTDEIPEEPEMEGDGA